MKMYTETAIRLSLLRSLKDCTNEDMYRGMLALTSNILDESISSLIYWLMPNIAIDQIGDFKQNITQHGQEILGRDLTKAEIDEAEKEMRAQLSEQCKHIDIEGNEIVAYFNENFHNNLNEILLQITSP